MANDYFQFKKFLINQGKCAMKVGTDGVLLGAWAGVENAKTVLDIGTGTGLIALMAAQRNQSAAVDAIEIDEEAAKQATENVENSPWHNRIKVFCTDLAEYFPNKKYDCIICNPPFFQNALLSDNAKRNIARHNVTLTPKQLVENISRLSHQATVAAIILPTEIQDFFSNLMETVQFFLSKHTAVITTPGKIPSRILLQYSKEKTNCIYDNLLIETGKRHQYSEAYKKLTKDFYL